jgi:hypothetical protein
MYPYAASGHNFGSDSETDDLPSLAFEIDLIKLTRSTTKCPRIRIIISGIVVPDSKARSRQECATRVITYM